MPHLGFVFLELTPAEASSRVARRADHYMPESLVTSQFAALEPPNDERLVLSLDAKLPVATLAKRVQDWLIELETRERSTRG